MSSLAIHPIHEAKLIAHAVRNIQGGPELVKKWQAQKTDFTERLPDNRNDLDNGLKDFLG